MPPQSALSSHCLSSHFVFQNLVPGTPLQAMRHDDRIPILMIQHSVETSSQESSHTSTSRSIHGWTIIIPAGWGMAFFSSLTHTGTRVAGQRERKTQAFEAGCAYFPRDYPSTASYDTYMDIRATEEEEMWERKPPAKRPNYSKIGTRSPWRPDWEVVLGLVEAPKQLGEGVGMAVDGAEELIPAQRDHASQSDAAVAASALVEAPSHVSKVKPWLLRGPDVPAVLERISRMPVPALGLRDEMNQLRTKRKLQPLDVNIKSDELMMGALVTVKITLCGRGSPEDLANIYNMDDEEVQQWVEAESQRKSAAVPLDESGDNETEVSPGLFCVFLVLRFDFMFYFHRAAVQDHSIARQHHWICHIGQFLFVPRGRVCYGCYTRRTVA